MTCRSLKRLSLKRVRHRWRPQWWGVWRAFIYVAWPQHPKTILNPPLAVRSFAAIPP
jgi:hypothetical protein